MKGWRSSVVNIHGVKGRTSVTGDTHWSRPAITVPIVQVGFFSPRSLVSLWSGVAIPWPGLRTGRVDWALTAVPHRASRHVSLMIKFESASRTQRRSHVRYRESPERPVSIRSGDIERICNCLAYHVLLLCRHGCTCTCSNHNRG